MCHLLIDSFTDNHLIVKRSKKRINPPNNRYAGILIDIFYDYFLTLNWQRYSQVSLSEFIEEIHSSFKDNLDKIPEPASSIVRRMIDENWLDSYGSLLGVERALIRIKRRLSPKLSHVFIVDDAIEQLKHQHHEFDEDFNRFFPQAIAHLRSH